MFENRSLERMTRIELALSAWKAEALPLSYIRVPLSNEDNNIP